MICRKSAEVGSLDFRGVGVDVAANGGGGSFGSPDGWYFGVKFDQTGSIYFDNRSAAYDYMWDNSFQNGQPIREVSGWDLQKGATIVMPFNNNGIGYSHNDYLGFRRTNNGIDVKFGNSWYTISSHVHTHPQMYLYPSPYDPGFSEADIRMNSFTGAPINVLYNRMGFRGDFFLGRWNILNYWTW